MASLQPSSLQSSVARISSGFLAQTSIFPHAEESFDIDLDLPNDQNLDIDTDLMIEDTRSDDGHYQDIPGGEMATDDIMQDEPTSSSYFHNDHFTAQDEILQDANDVGQENTELPLTSWSDSNVLNKPESTSTLEISHFSSAIAKSPNLFAQQKESFKVETDVATPDSLPLSRVTTASHPQGTTATTLPESDHTYRIQNNYENEKTSSYLSLGHLPVEDSISKKDEISNLNEKSFRYNDLDQTENKPETYYTLHPVVVVYGDEEISLFPNEDSSQTFFVKDESLATSTINNLFSAIREVLAADLTDSDELEFKFEDLELLLCEDSIHTSSVTLAQIIDLHVQLLHQDGIADPDPLYMTVTPKDSFLKSFGVLSKAAAEGKGISQIIWNEVEGDGDYSNENTNPEIVEPENPVHQAVGSGANVENELPEISQPKQTPETGNETNHPTPSVKLSHEVEITLKETSGSTKIVDGDKILQERMQKNPKALKLIPVDNVEVKTPASGNKSAMTSPGEDEDGDLIDYEDADDEEEALSAPFELSTIVNPANSESHSNTMTLPSRRSSEVSVNVPNSIIQVPIPQGPEPLNEYQGEKGKPDVHNDHTLELQSVIIESAVVDEHHVEFQETEAHINAEYEPDQYEDDGTYYEEEPSDHPGFLYVEEQEEVSEGDEPPNVEALNGVDNEENDQYAANEPDPYDSFLEPHSGGAQAGEHSDGAENSSYLHDNVSLPEQKGSDEHEITYDEDEDENGELILDRHLEYQENVSVLSRSASSSGKRPRSEESSGNGDGGNIDAKRVRSE